jgi:hypothetical protein
MEALYYVEWNTAHIALMMEAVRTSENNLSNSTRLHGAISQTAVIFFVVM